MMGVFSDCQIAVEFGTNVNFKKKQELRKTITDNGGVVSFIVTKKVCIAVHNWVYVM